MVVGILTVELYLPNNGSLKDKRRVVKSIKERAKQRFNISIAEIGDQDLWQKTVLGVACVGSDKSYIHQTLDKVIAMIRGTPWVEVVDCHLEMV